MNRTVICLMAAALVGGCASVSESPQPSTDYSSVRPMAEAAPAALPGTIYRPGAGGELFMDLRARAVGDILTIDLVEQTTASKESSTSTARGSNVDTGFPIFAGRPITSNGTDILHAELGSTSTFDGAADASQSNSLDGSITVTVAERLANGNLLVRGEKWITLNQGEEFIQVQGIIRPVDIGPDNTIPSTKVADARITYSGKGHLANSNKPGWLSRFFNTPWFPY